MRFQREAGQRAAHAADAGGRIAHRGDGGGGFLGRLHHGHQQRLRAGVQNLLICTGSFQAGRTTGATG